VLYSNSKTFFGLIQIPIIMSTINKLTIDNVTDIRNDIHNRPYRLIYTPESWTVHSETGEISKIESEKHFCYDESMFELLKPGVVINIVSN
tara:strand:+ start:200 stop:472 length:273 start_codon:yes stop_codon:yes gene_type:complete